MNTGEGLYEAFASKDIRFDGRFFVGVSSTGIYCRPVCRARMPKEENCTFFSTAAEAEKAGFRPCLLCRPELAPELSAASAKTVLAKQAAQYIEENCGDSRSLEELAAKLGYTGRHLRRAFAEEFHVSPVEYLQTCRLLLAKKLLTDTGLSVVQVAMASGFGSLRRFNSLFRERYHLPPSGFRRQAKASGAQSSAITVGLGYQSPYQWERITGFLAQRAIPGVEAVAGGAYSRTVCLENKNGETVTGWITVRNRPAKRLLSVTLSDSLLPLLPQVLSRVKALFDLHCQPHAVDEKLAGNASLAAYVSGLRVPGCFDPFELCVRAILGQQITVKAAGTLAGKLAKSLGQPVKTDVEGLEYIFPTAKDFLRGEQPAEETLGALGVTGARARAICLLARMIASGELELGFGARPEEVRNRLMRVSGIGPWTAAYISMRVLGDTNVFPETDLGIRKALGGKKPKEIRELSVQWEPWRSYATMALWNSYQQEGKE